LQSFGRNPFASGSSLGSRTFARYATRRAGSWGGRRKGAGRRRAPGVRPGVEHETREPVTRHEPVHVTMRLVRGLRSLRSRDTYAIVKQAIEVAIKRDGFAVVHYSVQRDHLHLLIEAHGKRELARGMQSLAVRMARNLNKQLRRRGAVFADRYHVHILRSPREIHRALGYVLNNARRHAKKLGVSLAKDFVDPISSAFNFDGWANFPQHANAYGYTPPVLPRPNSWLLRVGWRKHGLLDIRRVPG
jgi:REP element-mobilizing transposase RayT